MSSYMISILLDFSLPFSSVIRMPEGFGGLYGTKSKYGNMDITGDGAIEFFTNRIKITSRWPSVPEYVVGLAKKQRKDDVVDHANFAGTM